MYSLFCFALSLRSVYLSQEKTVRQTIKRSLLGNGFCVLHGRLTPPHRPGWLLWKRTIRASASKSLSGLSHWENLWLQANHGLPGELKASLEPVRFHTIWQIRHQHLIHFTFLLTKHFRDIFIYQLHLFFCLFKPLFFLHLLLSSHHLLLCHHDSG